MSGGFEGKMAGNMKGESYMLLWVLEERWERDVINKRIKYFQESDSMVFQRNNLAVIVSLHPAPYNKYWIFSSVLDLRCNVSAMFYPLPDLNFILAFSVTPFFDRVTCYSVTFWYSKYSIYCMNHSRGKWRQPFLGSQASFHPVIYFLLKRVKEEVDALQSLVWL